MSRPLVIFGAGDIAELVHYYFKRGGCMTWQLLRWMPPI